MPTRAVAALLWIALFLTGQVGALARSCAVANGGQGGHAVCCCRKVNEAPQAKSCCGSKGDEESSSSQEGECRCTVTPLPPVVPLEDGSSGPLSGKCLVVLPAFARALVVDSPRAEQGRSRAPDEPPRVRREAGGTFTRVFQL